MSRLGWSEYLFVALFLTVAVGGTLAWPSASILEAFAKLVVGTVAATGLWLLILDRVARRRPPPPAS